MISEYPLNQKFSLLVDPLILIINPLSHINYNPRDLSLCTVLTECLETSMTWQQIHINVHHCC